MTEIVKNVVKIFIGFSFIFGVYIVFYGHVTPGGGFAGGVIAAGSFFLLVLAYGKKAMLGRFSANLLSGIDGFGAVMFLAVALLGFTGGHFFYNFLPKGTPFRFWSAGIIPVCNIAIGLKVGASLFLCFIALAGSRLVTKKDGSIEYKDSDEKD